MVNQLVAFGYLPYLQQDSIATKQASSKRRRVSVLFFCMCFSSLFNAISVISVVGYTAIDVFGYLGWCIVLSDYGIRVYPLYRFEAWLCSDLRRSTGAMGHSQYPWDLRTAQAFSFGRASRFPVPPTCTDHLDHLRLKSFLQELTMVGLDGSSMMRRGTGFQKGNWANTYWGNWTF